MVKTIKYTIDGTYGRNGMEKEIPAETLAKVRQLIKKARLKMGERYPQLRESGGPLEFNMVNLALPHIYSHLAGKIEGKRILDLECGSTSTGYDNNYKKYAPWICRTLHTLGAKPIGIDIGNLDIEDFEKYQLDLTKPQALDILPDRSIDLAHTSSFFNSPTLSTILRQRGISKDRFTEGLINQLKRKLKPGAVLLWNGEERG